MIWIAIRSHGLLPVLIIAAGSLVAMAALREGAYLVQVNQANIPRAIAAWEIVPTLAGTAAAAVHCNGLWSIERFGARWSPRLIRTLEGLGITCLFSTFPAIASFYLPDGARWFDLIWNVAIFVSCSHVLVTTFGQRLGVVYAGLLYMTSVLIQQGLPKIAVYLPLSGTSGDYSAHIPEAISIACLAALYSGWTCNMTPGQGLRQANGE